ncbi:tetratricopeptide repeat protein [Rhodoferax sp. GW822-FHT02A01]|uniref:O-linked N-acetylglucosamine transferase, SPINDLY family protein n=1 Tax=Rhodoferax sp. GW822-FHT02A01 TaxID=3141537 RepID=UPI00315DC8BE
MRLLARWVSRWLESRGLGHVADAVDQRGASAGDASALHAMAKRALGRSDHLQAIALLRQAIAVNPKAPDIWCSLGAACRHGGAFEDARTAYEQALALKPDYPEVLSNLGEWHIANGEPEAALPWLERALQIAPGFFQARINQTAALFELGRFEQARQIAEQIVNDEPASAEACLNLGNVLVHTGKTKLGIRQYQKALELQPHYAEAHFNLSSLLGSKEDLALAIGYLKRRLEERGDSVQNLGMLASAYQAAGQLEESERLCHRILQRQPDNLTALITLGSCLSNGGDSAAAAALYKRVVDSDPTQVAMGSNILFEYNNVYAVGREQLFALHRAWAQRFEKPVLELPDFASYDRNPQRHLRIGYVSGDFIRHPVGFLLRDVLQNHDKQQFSVHCFSMVIRSEDVLPELRQAADSWDDIFFLSDEEVVKLVREQQIDILVDLSGHTAFHRLLAFARKPAPVQAEWIGYFHSTGLESIDYFITDPVTSPRGSGQLFSEVPVHLPHTRFCYGPPDYAPDVSSLPSRANGYITFGSFNRLPKLTDETVQAWSRILLALPHSRLVLKSGALSDAAVSRRVRQRFEQQGIDSARLQLREGSSHRDMLVEYGDIDIALDTFPFNGGMTTLEALWMGIPVVTLAGDTVVSRQTVSALANLGLDAELAFASVDAYVHGAVKLASNPLRLAQLRQSLRPLMMASPLRDARQFTLDLEALFRRMWSAWCQGSKLPSDL